jgi:L-asparaginase
MFISAALLLTGATSALAAPYSHTPAPLYARDTSYNASLPNITIFATGGTIAGSASTDTQTVGYTAGALGIQVLIDAVPEITNLSNVNGVQVANVGSNELTPAILLNLTQQINTALASPYCQGVVVTHGTDSLEETAFFLDLTINSEKPVVVVGAMRPATAISADGPINLLSAVTVAVSEKAIGRGTMIVLNDRIASAYYTTKTNANTPDTFKSTEQGFLGALVGLVPKFYYNAAIPTGKTYFDLSNTTVLPEVDILYGYQGLNPQLTVDAVEAGAKGLVLAGMGAGSWTTPGDVTVEEVVKSNGTQVVYSHRTEDGYVSPPYDYGIASGFFNPQKSRILLQLALNAGYTFNQTKALFEDSY